MKFDAYFPKGTVYEIRTIVHVPKTWKIILFLINNSLCYKAWVDIINAEVTSSFYDLSQLLFVTFTFNLILSCDNFSFPVFWFFRGNWIISISYLYEEKCKKVHKVRLNKNSDNWLNFCSIFGTSKDEFETQVKTLSAWSLHQRIF